MARTMKTTVLNILKSTFVLVDGKCQLQLYIIAKHGIFNDTFTGLLNF